MEQEFITPQKAKDYFEKNDPDNRPINHKKVKEYRDKMKSGKWELRDFIGFSYYDGYLINGQHRMLALSTLSILGLNFNIERNG
jgi:hypothetical protein